MQYDIIIVGAGISGATLAERFAKVKDKKVLILEKRNHIGGNCYDYYNPDGILVSKYGAHLFHTNYEDVWQYVTSFSRWYPYTHRVLSSFDGMLVPIPVNITTVNMVLREHIQNEEEMRQWLAKNTIPNSHPQNSEEAGLARVGRVLYEKMFKNYTRKQWDMWPRDLDASVLERIPVRTNFDDRYFTDMHQALPKEGYTKLFESILSHPNITVQLNTDFFAVKERLTKYEKLFFTGPIDQFFSYKFKEKLQYRSIRFEFETYDKEFYQSNSVINYPNDFDFIRIVEYKHFTRQIHPKTTISKEYPTWDGDPYYPVHSKKNKDIFALYQQEAKKLEPLGIYFVGRLANYKYFDMDQAFKNALDLFQTFQ